MFNFSKKILVPFIGILLFITVASGLPINSSFAYGNNLATDSGNYQSIKITNNKTFDIKRENIYLSTNMGWPVEEIVVSSGWGNRSIQHCSRCSTFHEGVDFVPGEGSDVFVAMNGTVKEVGYADEYGVYVILEHLVNDGDVWETVYAHMQFNSVSKEIIVGEEVFIGEKIGRVGNTGVSTGPHLHFEIRINGVKRNPWPIIVKNTKQS